ncbi:MAG TPA: cobalamin-dependent protein, partial [Thermoanaerobaculia bacterium]|nr:cobalamin-dependent protein [Thermoanaerobaculia bacterium]
MTEAPKALLVYPEFPPSYWGFRYALELAGKRSAMPPLGLVTVAALFPERYQLRVVDMNVAELTDEDLDWADLVLTSTMVVQQGSLREVIARCNRKGKPVAVGGPHPTTFHADIPGADHYLLDEVEEIFPRFLADWEAGRAARIYRPEGKPAITSTPIPRFDLLDFDAYTSMALQFSRGCPFDCEF